MIICKSSIIELVFTKDNSVIDIMFIDEGRVIERVNSGGNEVDKVGIINTISTKVSKLAIFKDLI